ncbi:hypothetical protein, partial [Shewanella sp. CAL98-MNA-CIBAN-0140]|uniref:hypothetical protein n=1 Tax=Shewanella sp. CAL98-MNA-CIBAN-0140 TaxID=3140462 RepID=UPI003321E583
ICFWRSELYEITFFAQNSNKDQQPLVFLGFSVVIDAILPPELWRLLGHWEYFIEDGAKWLGIVAWCSYFVNTSHQFLESEFSSTDPFKRMLVPSAADGELGVNQSLLQ